MSTASPMRVALLTPSSPPAVRGNAITVQRIASGLAARGLAVSVLGLDRLAPGAVADEVRGFRPDIIHAFHATAAGPLALECARELGLPAAVTLTGTDVNHDLVDAERSRIVRRVLEAVEAVVVFHAVIRDRACRALPALASRIHVIGQAVELSGGTGDLRGRLGVGPADFLVAQIAGVRRVKNIPAALALLSALHARHPRVRYVLAGPVLEPEEGARVAAMLRTRPWAAFLGEVPHAEISLLLRGADAAVNSSLSEGGMSNAVLEAMSQGIAVLASDIEGNRSVVTDGEDGFLYASQAEFLEKAERLLADAALRRGLGARARQTITDRFPRAAEIDGHLRLYRSLRRTGGEGASWI